MASLSERSIYQSGAFRLVPEQSETNSTDRSGLVGQSLKFQFIDQLRNLVTASSQNVKTRLIGVKTNHSTIFLCVEK